MNIMKSIGIVEVKRMKRLNNLELMLKFLQMQKDKKVIIYYLFTNSFSFNFIIIINSGFILFSSFKPSRIIGSDEYRGRIVVLLKVCLIQLILLTYFYLLCFLIILYY